MGPAGSKRDGETQRMTVMDRRTDPSPDGEPPAAAGWQPRGDVQRLADQLAALDRWHDRRRRTEEVVELRGLNREFRLDLERRQMVRERQHQALLERAAAQLEKSEKLLEVRRPRAVLVHRNDWLRGKVAEGLTRNGVDVVAQLSDGADAVGVAVVEQPDLLLVEDALPTMNGVEVLRAVQEFSAQTRLAVHAGTETRLDGLLEAGAAKAFGRRTPPATIAEELAGLVSVG